MKTTAWRMAPAATGLWIALSACAPMPPASGGATPTPAASGAASAPGGGFLETLRRVAAGPQGGAATAAPAAAPAPARAAAAVNPIKGTELDGIFRKFPISNSQKPESWPRVALTFKTATPGVHAFSGAGTLRENDCVTFDAVLWKSAADKRRFDDLKFCSSAVAEAAKGVAFRTLQLYPRFTFPANLPSTAAQRTEGPNPPFYLYPQDIRSQQEWLLMGKNTTFFLGSVLLSLGYDWDNDFDRRVWVVKVPLEPAAY